MGEAPSVVKLWNENKRDLHWFLRRQNAQVQIFSLWAEPEPASLRSCLNQGPVPMSDISNVIHVDFAASIPSGVRTDPEVFQNRADDMMICLVDVFADTYELLCKTYACYKQLRKHDAPAFLQVTEDGYIALLQMADELETRIRASGAHVPAKVPFLNDVSLAAEDDWMKCLPHLCNTLIAGHMRLKRDLDALALHANRKGDFLVHNLAISHARDHAFMVNRLRSRTFHHNRSR